MWTQWINLNKDKICKCMQLFTSSAYSRSWFKYACYKQSLKKPLTLIQSHWDFWLQKTDVHMCVGARHTPPCINCRRMNKIYLKPDNVLYVIICIWDRWNIRPDQGCMTHINWSHHWEYHPNIIHIKICIKIKNPWLDKLSQDIKI